MTRVLKRQQEAEQLVIDTAKECRRLLLLKASPVDLNARWNPLVINSWRKNRAISRGSALRISIGMRRFVPEREQASYSFKEYASICNDPTIGGVLTPDWKDLLVIITVHEMAHSAQLAGNTPAAHRGNRNFNRIHGIHWRRIYAYLRHELGVNEKIRNAGGLIGWNKITDLQEMFRSQARIEGRRNRRGQIHLALDEGTVRIRPHVLRGSHEALCDRDIVWNLELPRFNFNDICFDCLRHFRSLQAA